MYVVPPTTNKDLKVGVFDCALRMTLLSAEYYIAVSWFVGFGLYNFAGVIIVLILLTKGFIEVISRRGGYAPINFVGESTENKTNSFIIATVRIAQLLYGIKSVQLKKKRQYLKVNSRYFKVHYFSIFPIAYCNFYMLALIFATFLRFLRQYETTYSCTTRPEFECYNMTERPLTLITNCSLYTEKDDVRCLTITYNITTAIALTGGFLLVIPKIGFLVMTFFYFKFLRPTFNCLTILGCINACLFLTGLFVNLFIGVYFSSFLPLPDISALLLFFPKEQLDLIVISAFILSIFLGCPFALMLNQYISKKELPTVPNQQQSTRPMQSSALPSVATPPAPPPPSPTTTTTTAQNSSSIPTTNQQRQRDRINMAGQQAAAKTVVMSQQDELEIKENSL